MKNSQIILCKNIKMDKNYNNVLNYSEASLLAVCEANKLEKANNYSFVKPNGTTIDVSFSYSNCLKANYIAFQNPYYDNKWFFAFIDSVEYRNDSLTRITFTIDVFSTWFNKITLQTCYVEREHVIDDTRGLHTIPENIETGEYKAQSNDYFTTFKGDYVIVMGSTIDPAIDMTGKLVGGNNGGGVYGGVKTAYSYFSFLPTTDTLTKVLKAFEEAGKSSAIGCLFMIPRTFITADSTLDLDNYSIPNKQNSMNYIWTLDRPTTIDGYKPKNNKLYTYPYCYLYITNNNGGNAIYHYEKFDNDISFVAHGIITPSGSSHLYPRKYNGIENNYSEMLSGAKYPICGYKSDVYINWLRQNGLNIATNVITSAMQTMSGVAMLGSGGTAMAGAGNISRGLLGISNTLTEIYKHSLIPPQAEGNINTGDVNYANKLNTFYANMMTIKKEYAKVIDNYFSMFGYKVNEVKIPNLDGRSNWNYVKTIDCNFTGEMASNDLDTIRQVFDRGVTIWHNYETMLNYNVLNTITI